MSQKTRISDILSRDEIKSLSERSDGWGGGNAWLYGVWVLADVMPFPLFIRIRSMAEHACLQSGRDETYCEPPVPLVRVVR